MDKKLFTHKHFGFSKQVKFLDLGNTQGEEVWHGGIAINSIIICGCCGTVFDIGEFFTDWEEYGKKEYPNVETPIEIYENWIDIDEAIKGDS